MRTLLELKADVNAKFSNLGTRTPIDGHSSPGRCQYGSLLEAAFSYYLWPVQWDLVQSIVQAGADVNVKFRGTHPTSV